MADTISYEAGKHNKITAIVDHVVFKKTLPSVWDQWFLEMGLWHLRELKLDTWQDVSNILLPVTDRKTVILPSSYIDWVAVSIKVGQYFVTLGVNDKLTSLDRQPNSSDFVQGLLSQNLPNGLNFNAYGAYNFNRGGICSLGHGFIAKGSFKYHNNGTCKELLLD